MGWPLSGDHLEWLGMLCSTHCMLYVEYFCAEMYSATSKLFLFWGKVISFLTTYGAYFAWNKINAQTILVLRRAFYDDKRSYYA